MLGYGGGPTAWIELVREYDHDRPADRLLWAGLGSNLLLLGWWTRIFLARGFVGLAVEYVSKIAEVWRRVRGDGERLTHAVMAQGCCYYALLPLLRLGFHKAAAELTMAMELQWDGKVTQEFVEQVTTWPVTKAYPRIIMNLAAYAGSPRRAAQDNDDEDGGEDDLAAAAGGASPANVRALLGAREEVLASEISVTMPSNRFTGLQYLEFAALAAEKCGDDELASFYAERGVERYTYLPTMRAACRAVSGRCAARRGDQEAARSCWQQAADEALFAKDPLLCLRVAAEWQEGPEASARLVTEACHVCGRAEAEVAAEFRAAAAR